MSFPNALYDRCGKHGVAIPKAWYTYPGPGEYTPYAVLNPATHMMGNASYFPDRKSCGGGILNVN